MSRLYHVHDGRGERQLDAQALPLSIGGVEVADIIMPGISADRLLAYIAVADGHAYIQAADESRAVLHNHEILDGSRWLKSGDEVRCGNAVMSWTVRGDLTIIETLEKPLIVQNDSSVEPTALSPPQLPVPEVVSTAKQNRAQGKLGWIVFALFMVLLLTSLFVLLATPVTVRISPAPAAYSVDGFPPAVKVGERWLVWPGNYSVSAKQAGYRPLNATIDVLPGEMQQFSFELVELPGRIRISLLPAADYRVFIDGAAVSTGQDGITEIAGGTHQLRIETERYLPVIEQIQVTGRGERQQFSYDLLPGWADVHIASEPAGASVIVDSKIQGVTPLGIELMAGKQKFELSLEKYQTVSMQLEVTAGIQQQLDAIVLTPANGDLIVSSEPSGATISVGGVFYGRTPATLSLSSTEQHKVRFGKPGYRLVDRQIELAPGEEQQLAVKLVSEYGIVFVTSRPADAKLLIDGKFAGDATQRLRLTTRPHKLSFSKSGYLTQQITVTPRSGISKNIDITLKKLDQQEAGRIAAKTPAKSTNTAGQTMRLVKPTGSFHMGSSRREAGRRANENARKVQLNRAFYLSEKEVTNAAYRRFKLSHDSGKSEGVSLNDDTMPVVNVSWDDAARYCNWLSTREGLVPVYFESNGKMMATASLANGYRLPTEAEWSYVARKWGRQAAARYPWSGTYPPTSAVGNFADISIADALSNTVPDYNDGYRVVAPVGSFPAQSGSFYDLGGNVAEWIHDNYTVYPGMGKTLVIDPVGPESGKHHVVRGSSWRQGSIAELRFSYRDYSREARADLGFRIARYSE